MRVVIVEDDAVAAASVRELTSRYFTEVGLDVTIDTYRDAEEFLAHRGGAPDIALLDIQLPGMDGMTCARELRATNERVAIIFITSAAQYAIDGYQVGALSYLLKPVTWANFRAQLERALTSLRRAPAPVLTVTISGDLVRIPISDLIYIETIKHTSSIHTLTRTWRVNESLKSLLSRAADAGLAQINQGLAVNMAHVATVAWPMCTMTTGAKLRISRPRRREFLDSLTAFEEQR